MNNVLKFAATLCAVVVLGLGMDAMAAPKAGKEGKAGAKANADVPDAVKTTMDKAIEGGKVGKIKKETEDGVEVYEAIVTKDAVKNEVTVAADGTMIEIETVVKEADLPQAVKDTLAKEAKDAKILKAEKAVISADIKEGKVTKLETPRTEYEVKVKPAAGKPINIEMAADGTLIKKEEPKKADKPAKKGKAGKKEAAPEKEAAPAATN
ncbi:MAG: hypothetical protein LLG01_03615 [Planctomycetaceae bacterium]|nr:hypothetical protein [Planctomycetaceae bacterium]